MTVKHGTHIGLFRVATILKYNDDGTVRVALNEASFHSVRNEFNTAIPLSWTGQEGEFLGGYPRTGSTVVVSQAHSGQWYIVSYLPSDSVFKNTSSSLSSSFSKNRFSALKPGRILAQVKDGTRLFLDPDIGIQAGSANNFLHLETDLSILSHNFNSELAFTDAYRYINGVIKRDLFENSNRNITNSTLDSVAYDESLYTIGLDPSNNVSSINTGSTTRNPALIEKRELVYEFSNSYGFTNDQTESVLYSGSSTTPPDIKVSRRNMRTDALSLSLQAPNHLIEVIQGTAVDIFGNIVDINRNVLPIGKIDLLSLSNNTDKVDAFVRIREQLRKSIAYHFEINARKGAPTTDNPNLQASSPPDVSIYGSTGDYAVDYARDRSRFIFDIDKEGQFKLNVPASSEVGNIPLLTRQENFSVLLAAQDPTSNPDDFIGSEDNQDIYLENFASKTSIKLNDSNHTADGYASPVDRNTGDTIKYGTTYHDITRTCNEFLTTANWLSANLKLVNFDKDNGLNTYFKPLAQVVTDTIIVSGASANAGGRSALLNFDGFVNWNIGANTIDRQSLWLDTAGGAVMNFGRDLNGNSLIAGFDGDVMMQVGGVGLGNKYDSRFAKQNDAYRNGAFQIMVLAQGQQYIIRVAQEGISLISPGTINLSAQGDIMVRSNSRMLFEAEEIIMHAETNKRVILKGIPDSI